MSQSAEEIRREYYRQWRAKNKERVSAYNRRYWEKRAEKLKTKKSNRGDE